MVNPVKGNFYAKVSAEKRGDPNDKLQGKDRKTLPASAIKQSTKLHVGPPRGEKEGHGVGHSTAESGGGIPPPY